MPNMSFGEIEVVGLTAALEAADVAVKTANVELVGYELAGGGGMVAVKVRGQVGAVRAAVSAAGEAAAKVSTVVSTHIIARPSEQIDPMVYSEDTVGLAKPEEPPAPEAPTAPEPDEPPAPESPPAPEPTPEPPTPPIPPTPPASPASDPEPVAPKFEPKTGTASPEPVAEEAVGQPLTPKKTRATSTSKTPATKTTQTRDKK